jgi:hypothetical protein
MKLTASFLSSARSRLLPASVPFRFFAAAVLFHVAMWLALFGAADEVTRFHGGFGRSLAAVHGLTLGVLVTTAIGASVQLFPVATRRSLAAVWPIKLVFWLVMPGLSALVAGMYALDVAIAIVGSAMTAAGLILYAAVLADNLWRARGIPVVVAYGWTAFAALLALIVFGLALASDYAVAFLPNHTNVALTHLIVGAFGFMGMLALGLSHVLVPMFALSSAPAQVPSAAAFGATAISLVMGAAGALLGNWGLLATAAVAGLAAASAHILLMSRVLRTGMRKRLGLSFVFVRASWVLLPTSLIVGLATLFGLAGPAGPTLFGFLVLGGWLLTFLLGILQRILPFLASMHAGSAKRSAPPLSTMSAAAPLKLHAVCHGIAVAGLAAAIALDNATLARSASVGGFIGALALVWFTAGVIRRIIPPQTPHSDRAAMSHVETPARPLRLKLSSQPDGALR